MSEQKKYTVAAAIIIDDKGRLLLQKKDSGYRWKKNAWSMWGGHIKEGETPKEAMIREMKDETGLNEDEYTLEQIEDYVYEGHLVGMDIRMDHSMFLVTYTGSLAKIQLGEGGGFAFFEKDELPGLSMVDPTKEAVELYLKKHDTSM